MPTGFRVALLSTSGGPMSDGNIVPQGMDGMAAFPAANGRIRLLRNHEIRNTATDSRRTTMSPTQLYDALGPGGVTTLEVDFNPDGSPYLVREWVSLAGTFANCAGGPTPWGSWISCEESVSGTASGWEKNHGYNFEVSAASDGQVVPVPLKAMGRFTHEAVAVDPDSGIVYQTEDRNPSGLYRFIPATPGTLQNGGRLEMLAVVGAPQADLRVGQTVGSTLTCEWVEIPVPDSDLGSLSSGFVFNQGHTLGGAWFARLEGCWYGNGSVYVNATSGGDAACGQVFRLTPLSATQSLLTLMFESPGVEVLDAPDNLCVSPRGGLVLCEDGDSNCYVRGLSRDGVLFDLVRNNESDAEWAGACFSPDGRVLFVNSQGSTNVAGALPSRTWAIWGPWDRGPL
ncbi:MAG: DUF839 domain-containing protein [Gemmatimonadaceae bacterium]|nr:DUF839 domain-containing protein [Gemmatimonadaceae bacterium]